MRVKVIDDPRRQVLVSDTLQTMALPFCVFETCVGERLGKASDRFDGAGLHCRFAPLPVGPKRSA